MSAGGRGGARELPRESASQLAFESSDRRRLEMLKGLMRFIKDEEAPTAVEYGIMVAGIAVVIIAVVFLLGTNVKNVLNHTAVHIHT
jgi:pilus assembly protein Flp/PilA